jgi:hypothetical protein
MPRGNVQHDVVNLIDKYRISEILDVLFDVSNDDQIHEMREWFNQYFCDKESIANEPGSDIDSDIDDFIVHELEHHNIRIARLELWQEFVLNQSKPSRKEDSKDPRVQNHPTASPDVNIDDVARRLRRLERGKKVEDVKNNEKMYQ